MLETRRSLDAETPLLKGFYGPASYLPLWVTPQGHPSQDAEAALRLAGGRSGEPCRMGLGRSGVDARLDQALRQCPRPLRYT
jgi:hypothetical protein